MARTLLRQVENPIAFAGGLTRALSLLHLHAQYAGLMLFPARMSADWSFRCVPLVRHLADPRNLGAAALYAWLAWSLLAGRPWRVALHALYGDHQARPQPHYARLSGSLCHLHGTSALYGTAASSAGTDPTAGPRPMRSLV